MTKGSLSQCLFFRSFRCARNEDKDLTSQKHVFLRICVGLIAADYREFHLRKCRRRCGRAAVRGDNRSSVEDEEHICEPPEVGEALDCA